MAGSRSYDFESEWLIPAAPDAVWRAILGIGRSEQVWPGVTIGMPSVPVVGDDVPIDVRSGVGYRLRLVARLTAVEPARRLAAEASGDLAGRGEARLAAAGPNATLVVVDWSTTTERPWMNALGGPLGPLFRIAHERVMRAGERALVDAVRDRPADTPE
ncbi:SRPBCC family protein [Agromyces seonyuensis]|uniref:SRPBCC family protein n=1 Tax=Agromyces seonyuensis TaxID=2662446 RepID=A0A6I4NWC3_9MICO|nr:SRPBCC family protein [Agromyces seonyuensis]MWB98441.1 hypothetical protein [Agromyces seonyuensis]